MAVGASGCALHSVSPVDGPTYVYVADVNGDGLKDVVSASERGGTNDGSIAWHEFLGGHEFRTHVVDDAADRAQACFAADVNNDTRMDLLSATEHDGVLAWYEQLENLTFAKHVIAAGAPGARSIVTADMDGDGDLDVVACSSGDQTVMWFEQQQNASWLRHDISTNQSGVREVKAVDMNSDGFIDVLSAARRDNRFTLFINKNLTFETVILDDQAMDAHSVFAIDADGDGDMDVFGGYEDTVAFYEQIDGNFVKRVVTSDAPSVRSVFAYDEDGDNVTEVFAVFEDSTAMYVLEDDSYATVLLADGTTRGGHSLFATDFGDDGDLSVFVAALEEDQVLWLECDQAPTLAPTTSFPTVTPKPTFAPACGQEETVSDDANGATSVVAADVDGDGDLDLVVALRNDDTVAWWEDVDGRFDGPKRIIDDQSDGVVWVVASDDVNGDGIVDVVAASASDATVAWYEYLGNYTFRKNVVTTGALGAHGALAADVDGDNRVDILTAATGNDEIRFFRSLNDLGTVFENILIDDSADGARSVAVGDIDGDADLDIVTSSKNDGVVAWFEQRPELDFSIKHVLIADFDNTRVAITADLNGDSRVDVVAVSPHLHQVVVFRNDGSNLFTTIVIEDQANGATDVHAIDMNGDGIMEIVSVWFDVGVVALHTAMSPNLDDYETTVLSNDAMGAHGVFAADLDGMGGVDVVSAAELSSRVDRFRCLEPSAAPTTAAPSVTPVPSTVTPSYVPTLEPTSAPTSAPSPVPSYSPTVIPTPVPTEIPSLLPTYAPTVLPSFLPASEPSEIPTPVPTSLPTSSPSSGPTTPGPTTTVPTALPSTASPSYEPTTSPTLTPSTSQMPTARIYEPTSTMPTTPSPTLSFLPSYNPTGTVCTTAHQNAVDWCHDTQDGLCVQQEHLCDQLGGWISPGDNPGCNHNYDSGCSCCRGVIVPSPEPTSPLMPTSSPAPTSTPAPSSLYAAAPFGYVLVELRIQNMTAAELGDAEVQTVQYAIFDNLPLVIDGPEDVQNVAAFDVASIDLVFFLEIENPSSLENTATALVNLVYRTLSEGVRTGFLRDRLVYWANYFGANPDIASIDFGKTLTALAIRDDSVFFFFAPSASPTPAPAAGRPTAAPATPAPGETAAPVAGPVETAAPAAAPVETAAPVAAGETPAPVAGPPETPAPVAGPRETAAPVAGPRETAAPVAAPGGGSSSKKSGGDDSTLIWLPIVLAIIVIAICVVAYKIYSDRQERQKEWFQPTFSGAAGTSPPPGVQDGHFELETPMKDMAQGWPEEQKLTHVETDELYEDGDFLEHVDRVEEDKDEDGGDMDIGDDDFEDEEFEIDDVDLDDVPYESLTRTHHDPHGMHPVGNSSMV